MHQAQTQVARLETVFRDIAATRMEGVPLLHAGLQVQAVGRFAPEPEGGLCPGGAGHTLVHEPHAAAWAPPVLAPGQVGPQRLGEHRLRFIGAHEAAFGAYEMSLASPMFEFADQQAAVATAREVLVRLRSVPPRRVHLIRAAVVSCWGAAAPGSARP
ncbi:MAG: [NiFe]-hydrogenase assembly chaperone HybE [Burkholderiaceae bacterium]